MTIISDNIDENDETFFVNLSNATNATIADAQGQGTIIDDDTTTVSVSDARAFEGQPLAFVITLSTPSASDITVNYATSDGTAVAPGDYTAANDFYVFAPGQVTATIPVPTKIDATIEPDETMTLTLTGTVTFTDATGTGTIVDVSNIPTLSTWMLILMCVVLAGVGVLLLRR